MPETAEGAAVTEDWAAVARAINDRLADTRMTQMEVASRARISLTTFRELQHNLNPSRRRRPQTLTAVSEALELPSDYLARVLHGEPVAALPPGRDGATLAHEVDQIREELRELRSRLEAVEQAQRR